MFSHRTPFAMYNLHSRECESESESESKSEGKIESSLCKGNLL